MKEIRTRLANREYVIGLDLGVGSIGLAAIALDTIEGNTYPTDVVFTTSRIFSPSIGAADRRMYRLQRNALRHKASRLRFLWKLLATKGLMLPYQEQIVSDTAVLRFTESCRRKNPYQLRLKGLLEQLSLEELGYAIYHIANHRGSSSVRTFLDDVSKEDEKKTATQRQLSEQIAKETGVTTFIEILAQFNQGKPGVYRNKKERNNGLPVPTRDAIINELDALLGKQSQFYPDVLTTDYQKAIKDAVMYENLKIVPEAGPCPYFPQEQKLPKCHFLNEERRLWEALNNIRLDVPQQVAGKLVVRYQEQTLTDDEKSELFAYLRQGKTLTESTIKKMFPQYIHAEITLQGKIKKQQKIEGFRFKVLEEKPFWKRLTEQQKDAFFMVWTNTADDDQLKQKLSGSQFNLSPEEIDDALSTVQLVGNYAPVGKTAMLLLMKYIVAGGLSFEEAIRAALDHGELRELAPRKLFDQLPYYGEILSGSTQALMGKAWHSAFQEKRELAWFHKPNICGEEETYGRIANPVVHQTLNELRKLLNEVLFIFGKKPQEIVVEVGRELKMGKEDRDERLRDQASREKKAQEIYDKYCKAENLKKKYIQYFRLWEQQGGQCPYCTKSISMNDILTHQVDIDHILPKADTEDSSENNKVLAHNNCNKTKAKRTPFAAFNGSSLWKDICHYLDTTEGMKEKRFRFEMNEEEYQKYLHSKGFLSRFVSDNSYVAKAALEYLSCLFEKTTAVRSLKGQETNLFRRSWGLQGIDEELGRLHDTKDNDDDVKGKNRADNRHHSLDAIVAGYCTRGYVKQINTMSAQGMNAETIMQSLPIPLYYRNENLDRKAQMEVFRKTIKAFLELNGFVSWKIDNDRNGALLKATQYSIIASEGESLIFSVKKKMTSITVKTGAISEIKDAIEGKGNFSKLLQYPETVKETVKAIQSSNAKKLEAYIACLPEARKKLEEENLKIKEEVKKPLKSKDVTVSKKALELCGGSFVLLSNNTRKKILVVKEPTNTLGGKAFDTDGNLCIDLYHDAQGKLCGEVIRKVYGLKKDYVPEYQRKGFMLFERIYQGDILEVDTVDSETQNVWKTHITIGNALPKRTFVKIATFTEVGKNNNIQIYFSVLSKAKSGQDDSFMLTTMGKRHPRKVSLSSAGLVTFVSPVLQDLQENANVESH